MHEIKIPNPAEQYGKVPAYELVRVKYETRYTMYDEAGNPIGERVEVTYATEKRLAVRGSDLNAKVLSLKEWLEQQLTNDAEALFTIAKAVNVDAKKSKKVTVPRKIILKTLIGMYKGKVKSNPEDEQALEEEFRSWAVREGRWGLGCPNNCGRFWTFKPTEDLKGFEPEDPVAKNPYTDRDGNTHNGYLEWTPQPDGSVIFKCDNCGAEIKLTV
jgi:hypothetical protein